MRGPYLVGESFEVIFFLSLTGEVRLMLHHSDHLVSVSVLAIIQTLQSLQLDYFLDLQSSFDPDCLDFLTYFNILPCDLNSLVLQLLLLARLVDLDFPHFHLLLFYFEIQDGLLELLDVCLFLLCGQSLLHILAEGVLEVFLVKLLSVLISGIYIIAMVSLLLRRALQILIPFKVCV